MTNTEGSEWIESAEPAAVTTQVEKSNALTRAGGAYIPPAKLRRMQEQLAQNKNSEEYQRLNWELLKKHIHGQVNKVNVANIVNVVRELLQKNVIRGMGLLAGSILKAQTFSPTFSHVYAALVAIINSKFPNIGQLILTRLVIQFKRAFRTNNKALCLTVSRFIAHLANQRVAHEIVILEILVLLMDKPTDDSIEVAITLLKECGDMLTRVIPKGIHSVFERLRSILEDADTIDTRTQQMIEVVMAVRKDKFTKYPSVIEELDLIDEEDQISHIIELTPEDGKPLNPDTQLNYYKYDPEFEQSEEQYEEIRRKIIGDADDSDEDADDEGGAEEEQEAPQETPKVQKIIDMTEQDMVAFRRNVYLAIQSSLDYQEAAHKLIKFHLKPGLDEEMCNMIVDCCAQQRTYERFYGLLAERFCRLRIEFQQTFEKIARDTYNTIHRFDIKKIRIMAQLVSHLLATDAIDWAVLSEIKMNENDTSSSGRVYVKILFQELAEAMGQKELFKKLYDPTISMYFEGLLPRDHPKNTRFAINFFTLCGLGGLTIILREHYEKKLKMEANKDSSSSSSSSSSDSSDSSDSSSGSDSSSSDSSSSDSEKEDDKNACKKVSKKPTDKRVEKPKTNGREVVEVKQEVLSDEDQNPRHKNRREPSLDRRRPKSPERSSRDDRNKNKSKSPIQKRRHDSDERPSRPSRNDRNKSNSPRRRNASDERPSRRDLPDQRDRKTNDEVRRKSPEQRRRQRSPEPSRNTERRKASPEKRRNYSPKLDDRNRRNERRTSPERRHISPPQEDSRSESPEQPRIRSVVQVVESSWVNRRPIDERPTRPESPRVEKRREDRRRNDSESPVRQRKNSSEERAVRRLKITSPARNEKRQRASPSSQERKEKRRRRDSSTSSSSSSGSNSSSDSSKKSR